MVEVGLQEIKPAAQPAAKEKKEEKKEEKPAAQPAAKEEEKPAAKQVAPGDSSEPLYSAYILIFFALFYIGLASAFINRYGQADCKISDSKKNVIRGLSWIMIGISIFFILFGVAEAKGFIIKIWFTPKWIHMLSFIYHFIMFMLSIFLYVMFNHNDTCNEDFLLCDDFRDNDKNIIEGSIHSTINIVLDILMISSIVMSLISVIYHMMKDTN